MPNLFDPSWDAEQEHPAFSWRRARLARQAGAERLGASLYELPPGASTFPLHFHHAIEELLVVLAGRPTLRTLEAERRLEPGEVVAFPVGRRGAHRIDNRGEQRARVLIVSTMRSPEVAEYPDSGKIMARSYPPGGAPPQEGVDIVVRGEDTVDYFHGET